MRILRTWLMVAATLITVANAVWAQGVQTGTITGAVKSADGLSVPGVTVTVASPALQGLRSAGTDVNGVYSIKGPPAGPYTITLEISNFQTVKKESVQLPAGSTRAVHQPVDFRRPTDTRPLSR